MGDTAVSVVVGKSFKVVRSSVVSWVIVVVGDVVVVSVMVKSWIVLAVAFGDIVVVEVTVESLVVVSGLGLVGATVICCRC